MTIALPTLAVAFTASCVWLTVRIVNRRERWAKWSLAAVLLVFVVYPLSIGPWVRLGEFLPDGPLGDLYESACPVIYAPVIFAGNHSEAIRKSVDRYLDLFDAIIKWEPVD